MKKLTVIKILSKDDNFRVSLDDVERWRKLFADNKAQQIKDAVEEGRIEITELPQSEDSITLVKIGSDDYTPTHDDLEAWRDVFKEAQNDPDFKIFTCQPVEISRIPMDKIVAVE
jgi:hypothetical protein